ncbi:MAG: hypothetical protein GF411_12280 [Candidatus Lokiarchaeota archaeon]|nr:hypothetical protein [Candidatus Lokiarchaeota archaeon]
MRISLSAFDVDDIENPIIRLYPEVLHRSVGRLLLPGQISLLYGETKAPLTRLAHFITCSIAEKHQVLFLDSSNNYNASLVKRYLERFQNRRDVLENILVGKVLSLSDLVNLTEQVDEIQNLRCIVLDSLSGVLNLSGSPGAIERQRFLFKTLHVMRKLVNLTDIHFVSTSYSTQDWDTGERRPIGGNVLAHNLDSILRVNIIDEKKKILQIEIERSSMPTNHDIFALKSSISGFRTIS